jgi:hypothetical protein
MVSTFDLGSEMFKNQAQSYTAASLERKKKSPVQYTPAVLKESDYPETMASNEEEKQSLFVAQNWTFQLLRDFVTFYNNFTNSTSTSTLMGGSSFEELQSQLQEQNADVLLSDEQLAPFVYKKSKMNVRYEFAKLLLRFTPDLIMETLLQNGFDNEPTNWLFLYICPNAGQLRAMGKLRVGTDVIQYAKPRPQKKVKFVMEKPSVPRNYITQRVVRSSFFASPDLSSEKKEERVEKFAERRSERVEKFQKRIEEKVEKRRKEKKVEIGVYDKELEQMRGEPISDVYDEELEQIKLSVLEKNPDADENVVETEVERIWVENRRYKCDKATLWELLDKFIVFAPYYSTPQTNTEQMYYIHSYNEPYQKLNTDYSILSSGFPVIQYEDKSGFPCFTKLQISNKYDIVWLLLDLRIQEYYAGSVIYRHLIQVSQECQQSLLQKDTYSAVPSFVSKKPVLKKTSLLKNVETQKLVLTSCRLSKNIFVYNFLKLKKKALEENKIEFAQYLDKRFKLYETTPEVFDYTLKPVLLQHVDSNETNYRYITVPLSYMDKEEDEGDSSSKKIKVKKEGLKAAVVHPNVYVPELEIQFQNFKRTHVAFFDAVFLGSFNDGSCKISDSDTLIAKYEKDGDFDKLFQHIEQYILMLRPGGVIGVAVSDENSLLYKIAVGVFKSHKFELQPKQTIDREKLFKAKYIRKPTVFIWAKKPLMEGGEIKTIKWNANQYFTYMFKLKPQIQDIYMGEKEQSDKILKILRTGNVETSTLEAMLEQSLQELLRVVTVSEVNDILGQIKHLQQLLFQQGQLKLNPVMDTKTIERIETEIEIPPVSVLESASSFSQLEGGSQEDIIQKLVDYDVEKELMQHALNKRMKTPVQILHAFRQMQHGQAPDNAVFSNAFKKLRRKKGSQLKLSF